MQSMGDAEVDTLMREIAARLTRTVGDAGTVARLTESEFAVILPRGSSERASQLAQRILAVLYEPIELSGLLLDARSSIGISLFPGHGSEADALMRRASIALDQARASGNAVALFKGGLDRECAQRLSLMGELRGAIERDELLLYCQPKLQISSGRVCGAEALVRWQHPRLGVMNPGSGHLRPPGGAGLRHGTGLLHQPADPGGSIPGLGGGTGATPLGAWAAEVRRARAGDRIAARGADSRGCAERCGDLERQGHPGATLRQGHGVELAHLAALMLLAWHPCA